MEQENIRYLPIWSGWIRLTHWLLALGVGFLFMSAWAIQLGSADYEFWHDWHMISGQLVIVMVGARLILAFMLEGSANWRAFLPDPAMWKAAGKMLRFYLTLGRESLPHWFAHNPFWRLLYPFMWLLLLVSGFSGLVYQSSTTILGLPMYKLHSVATHAVLTMVIAHLIAVFMHDLKGKGASISGMISGSRYFHVPQATTAKPINDNPFKGKTPPVYISVDSIKHKHEEHT